MPRFSAKAKEIFDIYWYHTDIKRAESLIKELNDPLDIAFGKIWVTNYYGNFKELEKLFMTLSEIENANKDLNDKFIQFMTDTTYCLYYLGWYTNPIVSRKEAEKYFNSGEQAFQTMKYQDDWEKYFIEGWYYLIKASFEHLKDQDITKAIITQKKCIDSWSKVPNDGEYLSIHGEINLGYISRESGFFENVEKSFFKVLNSKKKYNNLWQIWGWANLSLLNYQRGNLQKAHEYVEQIVEILKPLSIHFLISLSLSFKARYFYEEGNYEAALKTHEESLFHRKQQNDPLQIFLGLFKILTFHSARFNATKDKAFLKEARKSLGDIQEMSQINPENTTITNYAKYAEALVLKHGNIRKKSIAMDKMEGLLEIYPNNLELRLHFLELLFEDALLSEDDETIDQIDELMENVNQIPLRNNPQAIFSFISQQIFLAKYNYYIKGELTLALDILNDSKDAINTYKLDNLVNKLDAEIEVLEKELTRWDHVDISIKDRIKSSEFSKYIQQALEIADKQM